MTYTVFKKSAASSLLALTLFASLPPPQVQAATLEDLQAQIQSLIAQISVLKGNAVSTSLICSPFNTDLSVGRRGFEVIALQNFLIQKGYTLPSGATGYFGEQTRSALVNFQKAQGITPAVGYLGPVTRARMNTLCADTPTPPLPRPDGGGTGQTTGEVLRGEASLQNYKAKNGDDTNLEEGQKGARVMDIEFDVEDGDARINRVDIAFRPGNTNNETDPWDTFTEIALYNGSDRVGVINTRDKGAWEKDTPSDGEYRLRISTSNWIVKEGESVDLSVRATLNKNIRGANDGESWTLFVPTNGIRGLDRDKASLFIGDSGDAVTLDIDEAGSEDELITKRSDSDPDATTLKLDAHTRSDWMTVFAFDLDTDDSTNDIEIRKIPVALTVGSGTVSTFMRDARLLINGKTYAKKAIVDGTTNAMTFTFKSGELTIEHGERVTVEVQVAFNALPIGYEGTTILGSVDTSGIIAEGADTLTGSQLSGSATGETHTMRTSGALLASRNTMATYKANTNSTLNDDEGVYSITFDVTPFNGDLYIPQTVDRGTTLGTAGVNFIIKDAVAGSEETASGTVVATLDSDARLEGGFFRVREGQTKTFTLTVEYDPEAKSFYKVSLYSINWNTSPLAPTTAQRVVPDDHYTTSVLSISN